MNDDSFYLSVIDSPRDFDAELKLFGMGSVFVKEAWLNFTIEDTGGRFIGIRISNRAGLTSFFAGVLFKRFGIKIIGSPFPGWGTSYMGICGQLPNDDHLVSTLLEFLLDRYGAHYIEIINPPVENTLVSGSRYSVSHVESLLLPLIDGLDSLYVKLKGDCRTYLRQFEAKGGVVTAVDGDDEFVDRFYEQLIEVFARQGMVPTHSRQRIASMLKTLSLSQADLLCLEATGPANEPLASSVFFGSNGTFYYWACASYTSGRHFRPSEAMIWKAIHHFSDLGYHSFDMMGVRDYKLKFSPLPISYTRITAARFAILLSLRNWAQRSYFMLNRLLGRMRGNRETQPERLSPNLVLKSFEKHEFAHYQSDNLCIYSDRNIVHIKGTTEKRIELPQPFLLRLLAGSRLIRRLMRLDKHCVMPTANGFIIIWQGSVYHWSEDVGLRKTLTMQGCRNPMHHSIARIDDLTYVFGEYGNPHPRGKNIYKTVDGGCSWTDVFNFPEGSIRHIHNCIWDTYAQRLWIFTGDFDGECKVASVTADFSEIRYYGDGTQTYRATGAFIDAKYVYWIMDSPLNSVRLVRFDKSSGEVTFGQSFAGPIYYYTRTRDGVYLVSSAQEPGPSLTDSKVHIYASRNLKKWIDIGSFEHDGLPKRLFRFGVGVFPLGDYDSDDLMMSFDSVKSFDGKVVRLSIKGV